MIQVIDKLQRSFTTKLAKAASPRSITARITTTAVDREGDVVMPRGMDATDFKRNPIMLLGHNAGMMPIGKWTKIERDTSAIIAHGEFMERPSSHPKEAEWLPDTVLAAIQQDVLKGVSIGFMIDDNGARDATHKDVAQFGAKVRRVITNWKLLEVSIVPIPANQEAMITAVGKGLFCGSLLPKLWGVNGDIVIDTAKSAVIRLTRNRQRRVALA